MSKRARATKSEFLEWFYHNCDLGPADGDVRDYLFDKFMDETGKNLPEGWNYYKDGETKTDR